MIEHDEEWAAQQKILKDRKRGASKQFRNLWKHNNHRLLGPDPVCPICNLSAVDQEAVKAVYVRGDDPKDIINNGPWESLRNRKAYEIKAHAQAQTWWWERTINTNKALSLLAEAGIDYVKNNPDSVIPETLLKVLQWIDRREGRVVDRVQQDSVVAINFVGNTPSPLPARGVVLQETETKPLMLSPTSIEVLDEPEAREVVSRNQIDNHVSTDTAEGPSSGDTQGG
jgi:hypothetical protein